MKIVALIVAAAIAALFPPGAVAAAPTDELAILQIEKDWCNAYLKGDVTYFDKIMTDDFTLTNSRGEVSTKAEEIADAKSGAVKYSMFENKNMKVRLYGDTAVVTGQTMLKGTIVATGKAIEATVQFTDTFVRLNGQWRAVAGQASKLGT